jgi:hypothetical protein
VAGQGAVQAEAVQGPELDGAVGGGGGQLADVGGEQALQDVLAWREKREREKKMR